jgi:sialate O-acetylesterase
MEGNMPRIWGGILVVVFLGSPVFGGPVALTLSRLFTDRAVLQRDQIVPVWGTAAPGVTVTVSFGDQQLPAVTDAGGRWRVDLAAEPASDEGRDLVVETSDGQDRTLSDVVVGDLWYCAG